MDNKVISSPSIDGYNNNIYVGDDSGNLSCLDLRDGTIKWSYLTGGAIRSSPAIVNNSLVFTSSDDTVYVLNKYSGKVNMTYNPGAYLFNSPITTSPVINGNTLFVAANDGYLYSIDLNKQNTPISDYIYYDIVVVIVVLIVIITLVKLNTRRKNK